VCERASELQLNAITTAVRDAGDFFLDAERVRIAVDKNGIANLSATTTVVFTSDEHTVAHRVSRGSHRLLRSNTKVVGDLLWCRVDRRCGVERSCFSLAGVEDHRHYSRASSLLLTRLYSIGRSHAPHVARHRILRVDEC